MLLTSLAPNASATAGGGGGGSYFGGSSNNSTGLFDYPYAVQPSMFPPPAYLPAPGLVTGIAAAPLPGSVATYVVAYSTWNNSSGIVWFNEAIYNSIDAKEILTSGGCGRTCGDLPINWTDQSEVASFSQPVTSLGIGNLGTIQVVAVTVDGSTYLFNWSSPSSKWVQFGPTISGTFAGLATDPQAVAVVTLDGSIALVTTVAEAGWVVGQASVAPSGGGATGVVGAGVALTPSGAAFQESVAISVSGSEQIQFSTSEDGVHFTTPALVSNYSTNYSDSPIPSVGSTSFTDSGGEAGQVSLVGVGAQLFLLFTTNESGQTVPVTESSGNGGVTWQGPYFTGPINGTTLNPTLTVGPTGLVYAAWEDPDFGPGAVEEAIFFPDGYPVLAPETLPASSASGLSPLGPVTVAVDGFSRPLLLWPAAANGSGSVAYSGGYLGANATLAIIANSTSESLAGADFPGDGTGSSSALSSLVANTSLDIQSTEANLTSRNLCGAQNDTARQLYQNLTHFPLAVPAGSGTVCAPTLTANTLASPILVSEGADAPNTYLAVYADWALEAEGVPVSTSPLSPVSQFSPYTEVTPSATLPPSVSKSESVGGKTATVTVSPAPYSPTAYELPVTASLPSWEKGSYVKCFMNNGGWGTETFQTTTTVSSTWVNVSIDNGTVHSFTGTTGYPSVWVYGLTAYQSYYWSASFSALTSEVTVTDDSCTHTSYTQSVTPVNYGAASIPSMTLSGTFATTLSMTYEQNFLTATYNSAHTAAFLSTAFGTTLPGTVIGSLSNSTGTQYWNLTTLATSQSYSFPRASGVNVGYTLEVTSSSRLGASSFPGSPSFAFHSPGSAPAESVWASCSFQLTSALPSVWNATGGPFWSNGTTTIDASWLSSENAPGFITYYEAGSAINTTISGIAPVAAGAGQWNYTVELHGLEPSEAYNGTFGVSWAQGCLTDQDGVTLPTFQSADPRKTTKETIPSFWEQDLVYDSITGSGGGIEIQWNNPKGTGTEIVINGSVTISGPGGPLILPFTKSEITSQVNKTAPGKPRENTLKLAPPLVAGGSYSATLELNYSIPNLSILSSNNASFTYHLDGNINGITYNEQQTGWNVTLQPCSAVDTSSLGPECGMQVHATPGAFSTNGLASDYLEKELDLNPNTLDTAGSHMLDLWNLTFSLLNDGSPERVPGGIRIWENSSFDPFASKQYLDAPNPIGAPSASNYSNISCARTNCPGNFTWSTGILWSYSALQTFANLPVYTRITNNSTGHGDWFRGVLGSWRGIPTLTLWGKLSWGASPLTRSTDRSGNPDGAQVNPLYAEDLVVNVTLAGVCAYSSMPAFNWAVGFYVNASNVSGPEEIHNYSYETQLSGSAVSCDTLTFNSTIPINDTYQNQSLTFSIVAYRSGKLVDIPFGGGGKSFTVSYNMFLGGTDAFVSYQGPGCPESGMPTCSYLAIGLSSKAVGQKVPTYLLIPPGNGTVQMVPGGGMQYVGEQAFDLIVVNVTAPTPVTSDPVPTPWGGAGPPLTLTPGPNDFLVPRSIFLNSTIGRSVVEGVNMSDPNGSWFTTPLLGSDEYGAMVGLVGYDLGGESPLVALSCYWQNRALPYYGYDSPRSGSVCLPFAQGTRTTSPDFVQVYADSNNAGTVNGTLNAGGLPSDPSLESTAMAGAALPSILAVNITNSTDGYGNPLGPVPSLDLLLAGLLDNSSGGLNGTIVNVTSSLNLLGLESVVTSALPNSSVVVSGLYGPPGAVQSTSGHGCSWLGCVYQALSGAYEWLVNGAEYFASGAWISGTIAWFASLPARAEQLGFDFLEDYLAIWFTAFWVITHLPQAAAILERDFLSALSWLGTQVVDKMLDPLIGPLKNAVIDYTEKLAADLDARNPSRFWTDFAGSALMLAMVLGMALTVVCIVVDSVTFGADDFLGPLIIGLLVAGGQAATAESGGSAGPGPFQGLSLFSPAIATKAGELIDPSDTHTQLDTELTDLATVLSATTTVWAVRDIETASVAHPPAWTTTWGAITGILALLVAGAAKALGSIAGAVVSVLFDLASLILDGLAFLYDRASSLIQKVVTLVIDGGAAALDGYVLVSALHWW